MSFKMYIPTKILFGKGELNNFHKQAMPGKKALIVISNGNSSIKSGALDRTKEELKKSGVSYEVFSGIQANPLKDTVMEGASEAKRHKCDFIVALGGGSVMDASKVIAFMASNTGDVWDYMQGGTGKGMKMKNKPLPLVAITTTAGTGSEVDTWGVITNPETNEKMGFGGYDELYPVIAIVDPELMRTVPSKFTAFQGWDALSHSLEGYINNIPNLMSDMFALEAIGNIGKFLPKAVKNGDDMEARERVAFGNTLSGMVMDVSTTSSLHSLEHAMSAFHQQLPHGAGLAMLAEAYFKFFIDKHVCDDRFIKMAKTLGMDEAKEAIDFIYALNKLKNECGLKDLKMSEYGITKDEFVKLAKNAKSSMGGLFTVDRVELSIDDCVKIYTDSYK